MCHSLLNVKSTKSQEVCLTRPRIKQAQAQVLDKNSFLFFIFLSVSNILFNLTVREKKNMLYAITNFYVLEIKKKKNFNLNL